MEGRAQRAGADRARAGRQRRAARRDQDAVGAANGWSRTPRRSRSSTSCRATSPRRRADDPTMKVKRNIVVDVLPRGRGHVPPLVAHHREPRLRRRAADPRTTGPAPHSAGCCCDAPWFSRRRRQQRRNHRRAGVAPRAPAPPLWWGVRGYRGTRAAPTPEETRPGSSGDSASRADRRGGRGGHYDRAPPARNHPGAHDIGDEVAEHIEHLAQAVADVDRELVDECVLELADIVDEAVEDARPLVGELAGLRQAFTSGIRRGELGPMPNRPPGPEPKPVDVAELSAIPAPLRHPVAVPTVAHALLARSESTAAYLEELADWVSAENIRGVEVLGSCRSRRCTPVRPSCAQRRRRLVRDRAGDAPGRGQALRGRVRRRSTHGAHPHRRGRAQRSPAAAPGAM